MKSFFNNIARGAQRMERASKSMAKKINSYEIITKAQLSEEWFTMCKISLRGALEYVEHATRLEKELNGNPEIKKIFLKNNKDYGTKLPQKAEPDWARTSRPLAPTSAMDNPGDRLEMHLRKKGFDEAVAQHEEFIQSIRKNLSRNPSLREPFRNELNRRGLGKILREELPDL